MDEIGLFQRWPHEPESRGHRLENIAFESSRAALETFYFAR